MAAPIMSNNFPKGAVQTMCVDKFLWAKTAVIVLIVCTVAVAMSGCRLHLSIPLHVSESLA